MLHILCHLSSVYNYHLQGLVTLTHIAERLAVELSLPVFDDLGLSRLAFEQSGLYKKDLTNFEPEGLYQL